MSCTAYRKEFVCMTSRQYKHLSLEERKEIETLLNNEDITLKLISSVLNRSPKCIRYEITHHRKISIRANRRNKCGRQSSCTIRRLCSQCISGLCMYCSFNNCNELCEDFIAYPTCPRVSRFPYVCSGCKNIKDCKMPKYFYFSSIAHQQYMQNIRTWKEGPKLNDIELAKISKAFQSGKENGHSINVILNENDLPISSSTAYRYVNNRYIAGYIRIDNKRAVAYKQKSPKLAPVNYYG